MRASLRHGFLFAAACAVLLLVAAACGSSGSSGSAGAAPSNVSPTTATGSLYGAPPAVKVADVAGLGQVLVSGDGRTLYLYEPDQGSHSACTAGCLQAWPPISAANPVAGRGVNAKLLTTANAAAPNQLEYNGHLLYYYVGDTKAGQITGASIPQWDAVSPSGEPVEQH